MKAADAGGESALGALQSDAGYRAHFMDAVFWLPYVQQVCQREGLTDNPDVGTGLAGTFPTFLVNKRWVIKFFGTNFGGDLAFQSELGANTLISTVQGFPAPALLHVGQLFPNPTDWPWPYLVFEFVTGVSVGEVFEQVGRADKRLMAAWLARVTLQLHKIQPPENSVHPQARAAYSALLRDRYPRCKQIQQDRGTLPAHLVEQIDAWLPSLAELLEPAGGLCLIHADLTTDHVLGELEANSWTSRHLIDFGDAMIGDFHYELIALHLDLFRGDSSLLGHYLDVYGLDDTIRERLPKRAMALALLHQFDVLTPLATHMPGVSDVDSLDDLTASIWGGA